MIRGYSGLFGYIRIYSNDSTPLGAILPGAEWVGCIRAIRLIRNPTTDSPSIRIFFLQNLCNFLVVFSPGRITRLERRGVVVL